MSRIAIFASGTGSNAKRIVDFFKHGQESRVEVRLIVTNNPNAGVLKIAEEEGVEALIINKEFFRSPGFIELLEQEKIDLIVLAGFLWLIPDSITKSFHNKIINIHPALLPKYGGKGMYGIK
ncbi:MAG: phosphoribosylglycinamide formyltransferase, partial [Bacteroidetes bacterium]|nr:phosphoribosylglycinamide formyltransferase [Bacteroidota bacterium]